MKRALWLTAGLVGMVALVVSACAPETVTQTLTTTNTATTTTTATMTITATATVTATPTPITLEQSQRIAEDYVRNSPTFAFDGMEETLVLVETLTLKCPYCWQFVFQFESRHAGYGDRTGQMLAQVITAHTARITVQEGEVVQAIMDDKWDIMQQKKLES